MDWHALAGQLWTILREHWLKALVSLAFLLLGTWWGRRRARREWERKRFLNRLNFSLNTLRDGKLEIRTLAEMNCRDVFLNDYAAERVQVAAERTTRANPIVPLDEDERWFLLNSVLNEVSERFAEGFIRRDMGLPTNTQTYLISLTYENAGDLKTRKIRAMVIRRDALLNLPTEPPIFERPHHSVRFETLHALARLYRTQPSHFLEIDLSI